MNNPKGMILDTLGSELWGKLQTLRNVNEFIQERLAKGIDYTDLLESFQMQKRLTQECNDLSAMMAWVRSKDN